MDNLEYLRLLIQVVIAIFVIGFALGIVINVIGSAIHTNTSMHCDKCQEHQKEVIFAERFSLDTSRTDEGQSDSGTTIYTSP